MYVSCLRVTAAALDSQRLKLTNVNARGADFGMTDFSRAEVHVL